MNIKQWRILVIVLALASLALCLAPFWQAYFSEKLVGPPTQTQPSSIEKATISATHDPHSIITSQATQPPSIPTEPITALEAYPPPTHPPPKIFLGAYPPPEIILPTATIEQLSFLPPTPVPPFPETPPIPNVQAVTLWSGDIWLLEYGEEPVKITNFGDVSVIFGWNYAGSKLLFGRGRVEQSDISGDTTDLWLLELGEQKFTRLTRGLMVNSAAWSPVNDRIAYTDNYHLLTIIGEKGGVLNNLEWVLAGFTWSPDGSKIALRTYPPELAEVAYTGLPWALGFVPSTLAIWTVENEHLQEISKSIGESQDYPVWSLNGLQIIFVRYFLTFQPDAFRPSGLYVYDIQSDQISILEDTTLKVYGLSRSPKANGIVYQSGNEIYLIGFDGSARMIGESYAVLERRGYALCWLPDGMSVLYETSSGELTVLQVYKDVEPIAYGGETESWNLNLYPAYYFRPGDLNE